MASAASPGVWHGLAFLSPHHQSSVSPIFSSPELQAGQVSVCVAVGVGWRGQGLGCSLCGWKEAEEHMFHINLYFNEVV